MLRRVKVPALVGRPLPEAIHELLDRGFVVSITTLASDEPPGRVLSQSLEPGARVLPRAIVCIVVAKRKERRLCL